MFYLCLHRWLQNVDGGVIKLHMWHCISTTLIIPNSACTISLALSKNVDGGVNFCSVTLTVQNVDSDNSKVFVE